MIQVQGRKVIVTGASSGIGRELSVRLSKDNTVILCGRNEERLEETRSRMDDPERHVVVPFDFLGGEDCSVIFKKAEADGEPVDGLVHCAGVAPATPLRTITRKIIEDTFTVNYSSFLCMAREYAKAQYGRGGSIVGVSSINAHYVQKYMSVYAGTKAALEASVRTLAVELVEKDIRINTIVPGAVDTEMARSMPEEQQQLIAGRQLAGMIPADGIVDSILFLLDDDASLYMTGRSLYVDGGRLGQ